MRSFGRNNDSKKDKKQYWLWTERFLFKAAAFICRLWGEELNVPNFDLKSNKEEDKESGEKQDKERQARTAAQRIDIRWKIHDHMTLIIFGCLFISHYYKVFYPTQRPFIIFYLGVTTFILIGVLFAKRYIEQTIHYQRVRELIYVLETAHVARVLKKKLPDPLESNKISYDLGLAFKESKSRENSEEKDKQ